MKVAICRLNQIQVALLVGPLATAKNACKRLAIVVQTVLTRGVPIVPRRVVVADASGAEVVMTISAGTASFPAKFANEITYY